MPIHIIEKTAIKTHKHSMKELLAPTVVQTEGVQTKGVQTESSK